MQGLVGWLQSELSARGWSNNELARRAALSPASVSQVMKGQQNPGPDFCHGVARALNAPPERVFRMAGLLPQKPTGDAMIEEILYYYDQMTPQQQAHFRLIARAFAEEGEEEPGPAPEVGSAPAPA